MARYYVKSVLTDNQQEVCWALMEKSTNQLVEWSWREEIVYERCVFFERGGAFDGYTPAFILRRVPEKYLQCIDINDMFDVKFTVAL